MSKKRDVPLSKFQFRCERELLDRAMVLADACHQISLNRLIYVLLENAVRNWEVPGLTPTKKKPEEWNDGQPVLNSAEDRA